MEKIKNALEITADVAKPATKKAVKAVTAQKVKAVAKANDAKAKAEKAKAEKVKAVAKATKAAKDVNALVAIENVNLSVPAMELKQAICGEFAATEKISVTAYALLVAAGYDITKDKLHNQTVLKACKTAVLVSLRLDNDFAVGDNSKGDKVYKRASSALQMQSADGRNGDGKGVANKPKTKEPKVQPTGKEGKPADALLVTPIKLNAMEKEDMGRVFSFQGTYLEFMDEHGAEIFACIAGHAAILKEFTEYLKNHGK